MPGISMVGIQRRQHGLPVKQIGTPICVPARGYLFELLTKLSTTVFCSKRLMHFQTLLNIYKFADSTTFRFVLLSVHQVKGDFILILALASNHLSVCVSTSATKSFERRGMERTCEAPSNDAPHMILGYRQGRLPTYLHRKLLLKLFHF